MNLLEVNNLYKHFGGVQAVNGLDFEVRRGEILGIIGPNGSGKTTVFNLVSGVHKPSSGKIMFEGEDITGLRPAQIVAKGLVRTFQSTTLFSTMTVLENVLVGCHMKSNIGFWESIMKASSTRRVEDSTVTKARNLLKFVGMEGQELYKTQDLSAGYQRTLGLAIALGPAPELLLLDETLASLDPVEVVAVTNLIRQIRETGCTIVVVEHNMRVIFDLCDRIMVMNTGVKLAEGNPAEIRDHEEVIKAYLGRKRDAA